MIGLRPIALVIAPFATATREEKAATLDACAKLLDKGYCPVFLPYALRALLDDANPQHRFVALDCSRAFVRSIALDRDTRAFIVGDRYTEGMNRDLNDWLSATGFDRVPKHISTI